MGNVIGILGIVLAILAVAATTSLRDAGTNLATWQPWATAAAITTIALLSAWLGAVVTASWLRRRSGRAERYAAYLVIAKTVRDKVLSWGKLDAEDLTSRLDRLEASEDSVWIDDKARRAREAFLDHARRAVHVRRNRDEFRTAMERSETQLYMVNATDRLVAALLGRKMPTIFDPFGEGEPSLWGNLQRRLKRILPRRKGVAPDPFDEL